MGNIIDININRISKQIPSFVESQAFYKAMGCREAEEYNKEHVEIEPCDCQLEFVL